MRLVLGLLEHQRHRFGFPQRLAELPAARSRAEVVRVLLYVVARTAAATRRKGAGEEAEDGVGGIDEALERIELRQVVDVEEDA